MAQIILFRGKPGVGKTTISTAVAQRLQLPLIRKDDIYDQLADLESEHQKRNQICENIIWKIIKTNRENETSIILDHSYHYPNQIAEVKKRAEDLGVKLIPILVICSDESIWKKRFNRRALNPMPNQIITDFDVLKKHYGSLETQSLAGECILDSVKGIEELAQIAVERITSG